jgi:ribose 5-phosphate isomerase B
MGTLYIASDHAAYEQKQNLVEYLNHRFNVVDLGCHSQESTHYPIWGEKIAKAVLENNGRGIALCGSGIGISISVNRFKGIRGALCQSVEAAKLSRQHNDSNILCLGARLNTLDQLKQMVDIWLVTEFEGGRHQSRIEMLDQF